MSSHWLALHRLLWSHFAVPEPSHAGGLTLGYGSAHQTTSESSSPDPHFALVHTGTVSQGAKPAQPEADFVLCKELLAVLALWVVRSQCGQRVLLSHTCHQIEQKTSQKLPPWKSCFLLDLLVRLTLRGLSSLDML